MLLVELGIYHLSIIVNKKYQNLLDLTKRVECSCSGNKLFQTRWINRGFIANDREKVWTHRKPSASKVVSGTLQHTRPTISGHLSEPSSNRAISRRGIAAGINDGFSQKWNAPRQVHIHNCNFNHCFVECVNKQMY